MAEHQYKEFTYAFNSKGLSARLSIDKTPPDMYWNLLGLEVRQEGALSTRLGRTPLTVLSSTTFFGSTPVAAVSAPGAKAPWLNPTNAIGGTGAGPYAVCSIANATGLASNALQLTNFAFVIPAANPITGILIQLGAFTADPNGFLTVQLLKNGVPVGTPKQTALTGIYQVYGFGSTSDLWGESWLPSDIDSTSWGFQVTVYGSGSGNAFSVNSVQATVYAILSNAPSPLADTNIHTLARLKGVGLNTYRYAGAGRNIYRLSGDYPGVYGIVSNLNQMSGNRFSTGTYRPSFSSSPYIFFADSMAMLKDSGSFFPLQQMGIFPPQFPATTSLGGAGNINTGAGSPYDYRYTYFNSFTGSESNPSQVQPASLALSPSNQQINVVVTASSDPQVTNINVYRRGGSLNVGWIQVGQTTNTTHTFVDNSADATIASNNVLSLTNDVPLTTTLPIPVNTSFAATVGAGGTHTVTPLVMTGIYPNSVLTIDTGTNQELVVVQSTTLSSFTAYFQLGHVGAVVAASTRIGHAVNLITIAFNQAWFAGDTDNPNRLYYSNTNNPETVPSQNWIEIGTPADPITNIVFYSGQLFVETQSRFYRVIIPYPGAIPAPYPTASRHGLIANFAWCLGEGIIPFLSNDGVYIFQGSVSNYASEVIEWLLANKEPNLGPIPEQDPTQTQNTIMAFTKNEFYVAYTDKTGTIRRLSYDFKKARWRNDDIKATAMLYEEDTTNLIIATGDGMIFIDRVGNTDIAQQSGVLATIPINFTLQTGANDQELPLNDKSYNELSLDMDSPDLVNVTLLFDNGKTILALGNFQTTGRQRIPIPINAGVGQISQNVSLQLVGGAITGPAHFYNWYIKAAVEAEYRDSFDSYWIKFGTDEYKFVKQGWFEYVAPDPAGITFAVYTEGNMTTPVFTFTLPQTTIRKARRIRFPATKGKVWRMIGVSPSKFQLYGESFIEFKPITMSKGYAKENLGAMITAQGSV